MKKEITKTIWVFIVLLLLGVLSTIAFLGEYLAGAAQTEQELITLFPTSASYSSADTVGAGTSRAIVQQNSNNLLTNYNPVVVSDDKQIWGTQTDIEFFKVSYKNSNNEISVVSANGDEVIAPGTENEYTFRIKNNSKQPIKYKMTCEVYSEPAGLFFPVEMSMKSYTGSYLFGSSTALENIKNISQVSDSATLSANNYAYYTLNWQWPFEWNDDEYDTYLGNRAVNEDLTVTVVIKTIAEWDTDSANKGGGLKSPTTGDTSKLIPLVIVAAICLIVIIVFIFKKKKSKEDIDDR